MHIEADAWTNMGKYKRSIKNLLSKIGLEGIAQRLWRIRPNPRVIFWNAGFRLVGTADKTPIPPTQLIYLATNGRLISRFLLGGELCQRSIVFALTKNGFDPENLGSILDFGCGCGRVLRHWSSIKHPHFYGTDYNASAIAWCQKNLGNIAEFKTNNLEPPLDYPDEKFDFIYAISVFTHLVEITQQAWMREMARVLKPGGLLLITLLGRSTLDELSLEEQQQFKAGQLVIKNETVEGENLCGAYHPFEYVHSNLSRGFEFIDYIECGARDSGQDIYLLKKPLAK